MNGGLIVNPLSGKGNKSGLKLAKLLDGADGVHTRILEDFGRLGDYLEEMAKTSVTTIFISSGDGTIQEIQTLLAEHEVFENLPRLCLLPHGTTNLTAADLGFAHKSIERQAQFIADADQRNGASDLRKRASLRIVNPADGKTRHGMFVGTGAVWQATKFCQDAVHRTGLKGDWATFATLAAAVAKSLFVRSNPDDLERIDRAYQMNVRGDTGQLTDGGELLFLATTLDKLILGTRPFWGGKQAAIRASVFPFPAPNILRWALHQPLRTRDPDDAARMY